MVSSTRVMTTGLPTMLQQEIMFFWMMAMRSGAQSRPKLPRDIMTASAADRMPRKLSSAQRVSI